jgi:protein subunit release factor B
VAVQVLFRIEGTLAYGVKRSKKGMHAGGKVSPLDDRQAGETCRPNPALTAQPG